MKPFTELVIKTIARHAPDKAVKLSMTTPIGEDGMGLDSIACLELILDLEKETGLQLRDENLTADSLATVGSLVQYLELQQAR